MKTFLQSLELVLPKTSPLNPYDYDKTTDYVAVASKIQSLGLRMKRFKNRKELTEVEELQAQAMSRWDYLTSIPRPFNQTYQEEYEALTTIRRRRPFKLFL